MVTLEEPMQRAMKARNSTRFLPWARTLPRSRIIPIRKIRTASPRTALEARIRKRISDGALAKGSIQR